MMDTLATMKCVACRGGEPTVSDAESVLYHAQVPNWQIVERDGIRRLERVFKFKNFAEALAFTQRVGEVADAEGHHPRLTTQWGKVSVAWWTHVIKGLHRNDFIMAAKTDEVYTASHIRYNKGETIAMPDQPPAPSLETAQQLRQMINGYRVTQMLYVAAQLGLADLLSRGAQSVGQLAQATHSQPGALYRLLRALASLGICAEDEQGRFANTPLGDLLRGNAPGSLRAEAVFAGHPPPWAAWGELLYSVQTGESAFKHHFGMSVWEYRAQNPDANAIANEYFTTVSLGQTDAIVAAYDFSGIRTLMDVAGGQGALIAAVLNAYPLLCGILFDQPHVVSGARALLEQVGVADRCEIVGGDFMGGLPLGADACMLKNIIHDWNDTDATAVLRSCRRALPEGGRLLVIDGVIPPGNGPHPRKLMDLQMLSVAGGRERTESEWRALLAGAGFALSRVIDTTAGISIIESRLVA